MATAVTINPSLRHTHHQQHHRHPQSQHPTPQQQPSKLSPPHPAGRPLDPIPIPSSSSSNSSCSISGGSSSSGHGHGHGPGPAARAPAAAVSPNTPASAAQTTTSSSSSPTCDACYRRQSRCAMNESVNKCYSCDFHRQECTFSVSSQLGKRKLEEPVFDRDGVEPAKRPAREVNQSGSPAAAAAGGAPAAGSPVNEPAVRRLPPDHPAPIRLPITSQHIGLTTELEPLILDYLTLDHNNESLLATSRVRKFTDHGSFMRMVEPAPELLSLSLEGVDSLVAPFGPTLIDKYFRHVHPTFPIVIEDSFRHCYHVKRGFSPALLAAVYLVALKFLDLGPASSASSSSGVQTLRRPDAVRLEAAACRLLNESLAHPSVSSIQAGLLLSQKSALFTPSLMAQLVTVGFDLGLHQDCSTWKLENWEKGLRKRLAWALYLQDKWCALTHGRPSRIFAPNWTVTELTSQDFEGAYSLASLPKYEDNPARAPGPSLFRQFVGLTCILSDILDTFYTLQAAEDFAAAGDHCTRIILERAKPIQIRLKDWFARLPPEVKMDAAHSSDETAANGSLHLAYFATEITLHRCIIRSINPSTADAYLTHICRSAAKTRLISAMDLVNRLRPMHLRSFWPSAGRTNFALIGSFGILLRITAETREEEDFYRTRLSEYRWTLSVSCRDAEFLVFAIDSLDVATSLLRNAPGKPEIEEYMARSMSATPPPQPPRRQQPQQQNQQQQFRGQAKNNGRVDERRFRDEDLEDTEENQTAEGENEGKKRGESSAQAQQRANNAGRAWPLPRRATESSTSAVSGLGSPATSVVSSMSPSSGAPAQATTTQPATGGVNGGQRVGPLNVTDLT